MINIDCENVTKLNAPDASGTISAVDMLLVITSATGKNKTEKINPRPNKPRMRREINCFLFSIYALFVFVFLSSSTITLILALTILAYLI